MRLKFWLIRAFRPLQEIVASVFLTCQMKLEMVRDQLAFVWHISALNRILRLSASQTSPTNVNSRNRVIYHVLRVGDI